MPCAKKEQEEQQSTRRGYGEGQLYQNEDRGSWYGRVSLGHGPDGKRVRKLFTGKTQAEVRRHIREALQSRDKGLPVADEKLTVRKFMYDWLDIQLKSELAPRTKTSYEQIVRCHIVIGLGGYKLTELDAMTIDRFLNEKRQEVSAQTVIYIRRVLHNAMNYALKCDKVARNVVALTERRKRAEADKKVFSEELARQLFVAFAEHRYGALYATLLGLGLRLGEGLGLRWSDLELDCESPFVRVQVQLQFLGGEYKLTQPKSKLSRRTLYLPTKVAQVLREHRIQQETVVKPLAGAQWTNKFGLVFANTLGGPLDHARVRQRYKELLNRHCIDAVPRLHDLRHMFGSLLISRNIHARVVQEMLGHSTCVLTLDRYSHINPRDIASAAAALDRAFGYDE